MNNRWRAVRKAKFKHLSKLDKCLLECAYLMGKQAYSFADWVRSMRFYKRSTINELRKKNKRW